jgi:hypothetical protein
MSKYEIVKKQISDLELVRIECLKLDERIRDNIAYLEGSLNAKILSREWEYCPEELLGQTMRIGLSIHNCAPYYYENKED